MQMPCQGVLPHVHAWCFGHPTPNHCSSGMSWAGGMDPAFHGPSGGWSTGHLYDYRRLATGPAGKPFLGQVIVKMQGRTLAQCWYKLTNSPKLQQLLWECNHLKLRQSILYRKGLPRGSSEALFQLVLLAMHRETTLEGCHKKIGHLGIKRMLDLMCNHFFWPQIAVQAKEHVEKCHQCVIFKAKQQKAPMESIVATHTLELVHIDYLCL